MPQTKRPPLSVVYRRTEELIPYVRNARTHSEEQIAQIAGSIREFGFNNPILTDGENGVIAGHGRLLAARKLGMDSVPCIELSGLSETQKRAYILADNKIALNAGWDYGLLRVELEDLKTGGVDFALLGFSEIEANAILANEEDPDMEGLLTDGYQTRDFQGELASVFEKGVIFDVKYKPLIDRYFKRKTPDGVSDMILEDAKELIGDDE